MKIVYAGTPDFAVAPLKKILDAGYEVAAVITQEDKPQGRKAVLTAPPVKTVALERGIPVFQPAKIRDEIGTLKTFGADLMITCAYGQILTQDVLDCFPRGVWNIHAGLLPQYRGASPIQSCILAGETQTGVSIMKTELGLDSGDVLQVQTTDILEQETYGELSERLSLIAAELIVDVLPLLTVEPFLYENLKLIPQAVDGVRIFRKISKEQAKISFDKTAKEIVDLVRAMNPAPVAYTELDGVKMNIWAAEKGDFSRLSDVEQAEYAEAKIGQILSDSPKRGLLVKCADGIVKLTKVQAAGGKPMGGGDFLNGRKAQKGQVFTC